MKSIDELNVCNSAIELGEKIWSVVDGWNYFVSINFDLCGSWRTDYGYGNNQQHQQFAESHYICRCKCSGQSV